MLKRLKTVAVIAFAMTVFSGNARAGYVEISATGSYRTNTVNEYTYSRTQSVTSSVAYYFWEMSALEISYTDALSRSYGRTPISGQDYVETSRVRLFGADLVLSFAGRQSSFRPYIKIGGADQQKTWIYEEGLVNTRVDTQGFSLTGGFGFKFLLSDHFAIKAGVDAWSNPLSEPNRIVDYAANAGISWMF
ncbi:MAG TPA: OmpA family protein [Bdellovibrionales bacterium]|nr:OmpA family protein [Bdellovibrionales bacterium]